MHDLTDAPRARAWPQGLSSPSDCHPPSALSPLAVHPPTRMVTPFQVPRAHPVCGLHLWGMHRPHAEPHGNGDSGCSTRGWKRGGWGQRVPVLDTRPGHTCAQGETRQRVQSLDGQVAQSCPTHCDPVDYNPSGSSVHGILQARILEWVAVLSLFQGIFPTQGSNLGLLLCRRILYH